MAINISVEKKHLYLVSAIMIFLIGVGVVIGIGAPSYDIQGHDFNEIQKCTDGEILKMSGGNWACGSDDAGGGGIGGATLTAYSQSTTLSSWVDKNIGAHAFCALTQVQWWNDDDNGWPGCRVYKSGSNWILSAYGHDNAATHCAAYCLD